MVNSIDIIILFTFKIRLYWHAIQIKRLESLKLGAYKSGYKINDNDIRIGGKRLQYSH